MILSCLVETKSKRGTAIASVLIICKFQMGLGTMVEKHLLSYCSINVDVFRDHLVNKVSIKSNVNRNLKFSL